MKLRLLAIVAGFAAGSASAAGPVGHTLETHAGEPRHFARSFELHIVQQEAADLSRIQRSGMIAQTGVAPDMQIGLGLFSLRRDRLNSLEPKSEVRVRASRKLGVSFNWKF